ncbi:Defensin-like protein 45 [Arabidopsis thaliana]|uniref:Defensin-like protein 45 n=4 Tax=Arabidopsis TaxID=3701 RepID=DEF45_ARATH|nr:Cysteine-rich protein [Arabidopsis thaliana]Q2V3Y8.1 RecName: Full=Defensin-like protein 45; Flags: Precursor [Arabidopsis thaliana]KAG7624010.1 hypothetical protein ISN45_At03g004060 [Arabidopsis thaliana x Arabidopsis arenosa]KAG7630013.1 hypothetical protein ISN44_As03g004010 [Arabidopsis suecica]AEE74095.1 Cysteine-rich protein [Arabidopsis thaliana]CAA0381327.1 unnamed protein product [Arabidopsis thaliana]CAD5322063.1 unnamed protein product [Arabidopsis thaliana]|eukprot:NP_001030632.1 Cysteine-rich protein [Arabidopsis thaliana]
MAITKTSATFVLLIILAASLSNFNVLASDIKPTGRIDNQCKRMCSATYGNGKCAADCRSDGFSSGQCFTSPPFDNRCCCNN